MILNYKEDWIAKEIADLLNKFGDMSTPFKYTPILIKNSKIKYIPFIVGLKVAGCIGLRKLVRGKKLITEICHLVVSPEFRRRGMATLLYSLALKKVDTEEVICYIRENNLGSIKAAERNGFSVLRTLRYRKRTLRLYHKRIGGANDRQQKHHQPNKNSSSCCT